MNEQVWGPLMWDMLFAIVWHAQESDMSDVKSVLTELMPKLLPCHDCRVGFLMHLPSVRRRTGDPTTPAKAFSWLYHLKDEVNKSLKPPVKSIAMKDLQARFMIRDCLAVDDLKTSDLIILVAIEAKELQREKEYRDFCHLLSKLIPVVEKSILPNLLSSCDNYATVTNHAMAVSHGVRKCRGVRVRPLKHFKQWGDA